MKTGVFVRFEVYGGVKITNSCKQQDRGGREQMRSLKLTFQSRQLHAMGSHRLTDDDGYIYCVALLFYLT